MASTAVDEKDQQGGEPREVKATVTFPLASKPPFKGDIEPDTTVDAVRTAAMAHFGVADDQTTVFYLTHKGDRAANTATIGSVADRARAVKLTLAKELIQG